MSAEDLSPAIPRGAAAVKGLVPLLETAEADEVTDTLDALRAAGVPYELGLLAGGTPQVLFSVPAERVAEARAAVAAARALRGGSIPPAASAPVHATMEPQSAEEEPETPRLVPHAGKFPYGAVYAALSLVVVHLAIVVWQISPLPPGRELIRWGALVEGGTLREPWRLLTSLFLHGDVLHAIWNGLSMTAFAVPLLVDLGYARTAMIYLASGVGGGVAALQFSAPGTLVIGSSGAVAGLFGAWLVHALPATRGIDLPWRERIRVLGIALLMLPALLTPTTPTGQQVSVSSHLGGMATGMLVGALISVAFPRRRDPGGPGARVIPFPGADTSRMAGQRRAN